MPLYEAAGYSPTSAAHTGFPITPSDTVDLEQVTKGIYVGGAGNVSVRFQDDRVVTFTAPPVGTVLPVAVKRVMATLTTATLLIGLA